MIFWNKFCGLVLFLSISSLCAPAQNTLSRLNTAFYPKNKLYTSGFPGHVVQPISIVTGSYHIQQIVPADFYTCNIGFFCKKELLIEKTTGIPLRFRLGSLKQCNNNEGKKQ